MNEKELKNKIAELRHENNNLKRDLEKLGKKTKKIQNNLMKCHEEMRELHIKLGAKRVGGYRKENS